MHLPRLQNSKMPVGLGGQDVCGSGYQGSLAFFTVGLSFVQHSQSPLGLETPAHIALPNYVLYLSKNGSWESSYGEPHNLVCSSLAIDKLTCHAKQHPTPPLLPTVILSVLEST